MYLIVYVLQYYFPGRLSEFSLRILAFQTTERNFGARRSDEWVAQLLTSMVTTVGFALFLFALWVLFYPDAVNFNTPLALLAIGLLVQMFFMMRYGVVKLLSSTAGAENLGDQYFSLYTSFGFMLSMVLAALAVPIFFLPVNQRVWVFLGLAIWGLSFLLRVAKTGMLGLSASGIPFKYLLLYICTLEILPVAVLVKYLYSRLNG